MVPDPVRVCLGGTFDPLHVGHEALLSHAFQVAGAEGEVFIGLVADRFANEKRERTVAPYAEREAAVRRFVERKGWSGRLRMRPLEDAYGPSVTGEYDAIVTSVETVHTAQEINRVRTDKGLPPLRVEVVPFVLGEDLLPVNATRVRRGLIDRDGRRLVPLVVRVGSANPVKVAAVEAVFREWLPGVALDVQATEVESGVVEQPFDVDTVKGAEGRAKQALEVDEAPSAEDPGAEYGVGIEAGLFEDLATMLWMDVQHCVIVDRTGYETHGHGPGFCYPRAVMRPVLDDGKTIEEALAPLSGEARIGRTQGAVGWLTEGRLDRSRLTRSAVEAALVPRVRRRLYELPDGKTTLDAERE